MSRYKTLRMWSLLLMAIGVLSMVSASVGVVAWAVTADGFWETTGVILFGGPIAVLLAAWPFALGQALRALADIGDAVGVDTFLASPGLRSEAYGPR
jgi:hypothetical protein